jgi:hypothetical protein
MLPVPRDGGLFQEPIKAGHMACAHVLWDDVARAFCAEIGSRVNRVIFTRFIVVAIAEIGFGFHVFISLKAKWGRSDPSPRRLCDPKTAHPHNTAGPGDGSRPRCAKVTCHALSRQLVADYGRGYTEKNLRRMIQFAEAFPEEEIVATLRVRRLCSHCENSFSNVEPGKIHVLRRHTQKFCQSIPMSRMRYPPM